MARNGQPSRILKLLILLHQNRTSGVRLEIFFNELKASKRTFYRDLDCIISAGFDVRPIRFEDGELRYYLAYSPIDSRIQRPVSSDDT